MIYSVPHYINGKKIQIDNENYFNITNPALGKNVGKVNFANQEICDLAINSAQQAWQTWSQTTVNQRVQILLRAHALITQHLDKLAQLITNEHGKTLADSKGSILRALEVIESYCGLMHRLQGKFSANITAGVDAYTIYQSLGVCLGISPFNFPIMVPGWMIIPAIACGNTFILKPSEQDPSAIILFLDLLHEAGLPPGVINCIHGDKKTVDYLLAHPDIKACTAVASTPIAEYIYKTATNYGKRAHTFGAAKNHCLVMPDANIAQAATAIVGAAYGSAGERCMAIAMIVTIDDSTTKELLDHMIPLIQKIRMDPGDNPNSDIGPVVSRAHYQRIITAINQSVIDGAKLLIDGRGFQHKNHPEGFFIAPTLVDHVTCNMSLYQDEIFGPVLGIIRTQSFMQALAIINQHRYGNGAVIFTQNGASAREFGHLVQTGMVGINIPIPVPIVAHPFGGWKASSFGDTNMHGEESINFYTKRKTITSLWRPTNYDDQRIFVMPTNE